MRRFESAADAGGLTYDEMMQRAGTAVADAVRQVLEPGQVTVLSGPGNNGGDGLVAAASLHDGGYPTTVFLWKREQKGDPLIKALVERGVAIHGIRGEEDLERLRQALGDTDAVIDALLGTGASRPIEGLLARILDTLDEVIAERYVLVAAVDVPTGLNVDTGAVDPHTVPADVTVTFGFPKIGQFRFPGAEYLGELIIDGIGIPDFADEADLRLATVEGVLESLPERPMESHKGTFGRALIVAGSANYTGAAYLAGAAAYRAGCGLVTVALPGSIHTAIASLLPEATYLLLSEDLGVIARPAAEIIRDRWGDYDAVLLGPGFTTERATAEFVADLLAGDREHGGEWAPIGFGTGPREPDETEEGDAGTSDPPPAAGLVVDADGLNLLAQLEDGPAALPPGSVLTPHPGEMSRLTGRPTAEINSDRVATARTAAADWGHTVVLKGAFTVVAAPDGRTTVVPFADSALATAGTGDVLSGLIVGFLAQGMDQFDAAVAGAFIHGLAGQRAGEIVGARATTAGDVLDEVAEVVWEMEG
jgi:NAD(P)H-hydrate epimerase